MQKVMIGLMGAVIVAGLAFVAFKAIELRKPVERTVITGDAQIADFISTIALPIIMKDVGKACGVQNPDGSKGLDMALVVETLAHGMRVKSAASTSDAGTPEFADCLVKQLPGKTLDDPAFSLPTDREYAFEVWLALPRTQAN